MSNRVKIIINADDFGMSMGTNNAICRVMDKNRVTRVSVCANGFAAKEAVQYLKSSNFPVGVHLTLTELPPILPRNTVPTLYQNNNGVRKTYWNVLYDILTQKISPNDITKEFSAQIEYLLDNGIKLAHIDSHHHIHIVPNIFNIVLKLAVKYKISYIRIPREPLITIIRSDSSTFRKLTTTAISFFGKVMQNRIRANHLTTSDYFIGLSCSGNVNISELSYALSVLPPGCHELAVHPKLLDKKSESFFSIQGNPEEELSFLMNPSFPQIFRDLGIDLVSC